MSGRLAFQTQLASIMEVLANAAVAEICRLVEDDYAVVQLQMSQCQRENKALKRKNHLLEIKMARGNAERRLRDSAMHSGRPRLQVPGTERLRGAAAGAGPNCTGAAFGTQMDVVLWSETDPAGDTRQIHSDSMHRKSPDVELVEPESAQVKEEQLEANMSRLKEVNEDVALIGDDGVVDHVLSAPAGPRSSLEQRQTQSTHGKDQDKSVRRRRAGSRGVEKEQTKEEDDVVLVKVEEVEEVKQGAQTDLSIQEGLVESSTDDLRAALPFDEVTHASANQLCGLQESARGFSEHAAPQSVPVMSRDRVVAAQQTLPGTNADPKDSTPLSSEYSLFDLETLFTRWAPDPDAAAPPGGPSHSLSPKDTGDGDQDAVIIVESDIQAPGDLQPIHEAAERMSRGFNVHVQLPIPPASVHHRTPWSRPPPLLASTQAPPSRSSVPSNIPGVGSSADISASLRVGMALAERRRKNYLCRACGKAFSGQSNLEAHERVHTGERPFSCSTCGKRFSEAGNLRKHQRVHTGEKPYRCQLCGKSFAWICNLRTHQQSASGCGPQVGGAPAER